ncbi:MAG: S1C family serine protease [Miltoncostaeaceae bacterium]
MPPYGPPRTNPFATPGSPEPRGPRRPPPRWLTSAVLPAVVGGLVARGGAAATGNLCGGGETTTVGRPVAELAVDEGAPVPPPPLATESRSDGSARTIQQIVKETSPSIVTVTSVGDDAPQLGSGFVIDRHGRILTNDHVLADEGVARVSFEDGTVREAEILGRDPSTDLAVLEVDELPASTKPVPLGSSSSLTVGDDVVAIGNPFGLERTATTGIVSGLKRNINAPDGFPIQNTIQTDAAIDRGNSGGPLLDAAGRVVGINSQINTRDGDNDGVGFAIPVDTVRPVAESIIATGEPQHAWIGITGTQLTPDDAKELGVEGRRGVAVIEVDDRGPADEGGFRERASGVSDTEPPRGSDLIVEINGRAVIDMADVSQAVASRRVGASIEFGLLRDGEPLTITLTLADRPDDIGVDG